MFTQDGDELPRLLGEIAEDEVDLLGRPDLVEERDEEEDPFAGRGRDDLRRERVPRFLGHVLAERGEEERLFVVQMPVHEVTHGDRRLDRHGAVLLVVDHNAVEGVERGIESIVLTSEVAEGVGERRRSRRDQRPQLLVLALSWWWCSVSTTKSRS